MRGLLGVQHDELGARQGEECVGAAAKRWEVVWSWRWTKWEKDMEIGACAARVKERELGQGVLGLLQHGDLGQGDGMEELSDGCCGLLPWRKGEVESYVLLERGWRKGV